MYATKPTMDKFWRWDMLSPDPLIDAVEEFPAIDLACLGATSVGRRRDRKYILNESGARSLMAELPSTTMALCVDGSREFGYESMYFDTGDLMCFNLAAKGRRRRFKVRTRHYLTTDEQWLEVKTRGPRGLTLKDRTRFDGSLDPQWVEMVLATHGISPVPAENLVPTSDVSYTRSTLVLPDFSRVTIDRDLRWRSYETTREVPGLVIVETKTSGGANDADHLLWNHGVRPCHMSKYATGMALLFPSLTTNRWKRTLARLNAIQENHETEENLDADGRNGAVDPRRVYACG